MTKSTIITTATGTEITMSSDRPYHYVASLTAGDRKISGKLGAIVALPNVQNHMIVNGLPIAFDHRTGLAIREWTASVNKAASKVAYDEDQKSSHWLKANGELQDHC